MSRGMAQPARAVSNVASSAASTPPRSTSSPNPKRRRDTKRCCNCCTARSRLWCSIMLQLLLSTPWCSPSALHPMHANQGDYKEPPSKKQMQHHSCHPATHHQSWERQGPQTVWPDTRIGKGQHGIVQRHHKATAQNEEHVQYTYQD